VQELGCNHDGLANGKVGIFPKKKEKKIKQLNPSFSSKPF